MQKIKLQDGRWITLNDQQEALLLYVKDWLVNKAVPTNPQGSKLLFCLEGFAGTGKSTIIREAVHEYMDGPGRWAGDVAVTAPTHKAKKVISDNTGLNGKTIQSLIGLAPNTDVLHFDINNPEFSLRNKPGIELHPVILIDEASMLNKDLFEMLIKQAKMYNVKLLFMCDSAQLPPVKEEMSPVVTSSEIGFRFQLTKVERQAGDNPLMLVYDAIRNDIESKFDSFSHRTSLIDVRKPAPEKLEGETEESYNVRMDEWLDTKPTKAGIEFILELSKFGSRVVTAFASEQFRENPSHCKMLCWTNDRVKFWNDQVRLVLVAQRRKGLLAEDLGDRIHDPIVMPGELLMGYTNYTKGITNAAEYRVGEIEQRIEVCDFGFFDNDTKTREYSVEISVYNVWLYDVDNPNIELEVKIVEPTTENYKNFLIPFNWYLAQGKSGKWPMYFGWKEKFMLLSDIKTPAGKMIVKKDLDYAYALTTHKSQGSTYNEVFIDEADIDRNPNWIERNKLKYVALSRPRFKATVLTGKTD